MRWHISIFGRLWLQLSGWVACIKSSSLCTLLKCHHIPLRAQCQHTLLAGSNEVSKRRGNQRVPKSRVLAVFQYISVHLWGWWDELGQLNVFSFHYWLHRHTEKSACPKSRVLTVFQYMSVHLWGWWDELMQLNVFSFHYWLHRHTERSYIKY